MTNKTYIITLLLVMILHSLFSIEQKEVKAQIITEEISLLLTPDFNSAYSGSAYLNSKVTILSKTDWLENSYPWYFVMNRNETGWIHGSNLVILADNNAIQLIKIDNQYNQMKYQILLSEFLESPFNNNFKIPPNKIKDPESIIDKYGTELKISSTSSEDKHDSSIQLIHETLTNDVIEIMYSKGNDGYFYLDLYSIKSVEILNNQLANIITSEDLFEVIGKPRSTTEYKGKDIYFYMDRVGKQVQFRYENNIFNDIGIIYYEG